MSGEGKNDEISLNVKTFKEGYGKTKKFFSNKKVQIVLTVILILGILILGSWIRVQNLSLLKDQTTGKFIPLALDPFYFLRVADTIITTGGHLPAVDVMRNPAGHVGFTTELLPHAIVLVYKIGNIFSNISIEFADVITPIIFYILGLLAFFFLAYRLTKSKIASVMASVFLAFIPSYLYRTLAGFADHEAIGMFSFFLVLFVYAFSVQKLEKEKSQNKKYLHIGLGILIGLLTVMTVASWGGLSNFVFMILPLSALIIWAVEINKNRDNWKKYVLLYSSWIISSLILAPVVGIGFGTVLARMKTPTGLISLFVLVFMVVDSLLINYGFEKRLKKKKEFYRVVYSLLISLGLGLVFLIVQGNLIQVISDLAVKILNPFSSAGSGRLGSTVAENASPYLKDWISQTGKIFFWISLSGLVLFGIKFFEKIPKQKDKIKGLLLWILLIGGIFLSRYSSSSIFNGENFISKLFFFGSVILFLWFLGKLYYRNELRVSSTDALIFSWMILMLIGARGAARLLFVITPFFCFISGWNFDFLIKNLKQKDELKKMFVIIAVAGLIVASVFALSNFVSASKAQAQYTGPSANYQWQNAMKWVRDNTTQGSIFIHWWDYGYWIQTLGERPTVTDGGHAGGDNTDHYIGRYILTTPNPETALSYMKTENVSYLLIDQTDLGKYSAYSRIGGDNNFDRYSYIPTGTKDPSQTRETNNQTMNVYRISMGVDEDIIYTQSDGNQIFIPGPTYSSDGTPNYKAYIGGIIFAVNNTGNGFSPQQAKAVYFYQGNQISIPLRYLYVQGQLIDFGSGLDGVFFVYPQVSSSGQGLSIDSVGAGIYLSPKVSKSLFAQLYLMDDPNNEYPTLSIAHSEPDMVVNSLNSQGANLGDFVYYNGFRGPIKIWKVDYPAGTPIHKEFLDSNFSFGGLDYLFN